MDDKVKKEDLSPSEVVIEEDDGDSEDEVPFTKRSFVIEITIVDCETADESEADAMEAFKEFVTECIGEFHEILEFTIRPKV